MFEEHLLSADELSEEQRKALGTLVDTGQVTVAAILQAIDLEGTVE